jgi:hypothetical protein
MEPVYQRYVLMLTRVYVREDQTLRFSGATSQIGTVYPSVSLAFTPRF